MKNKSKKVNSFRIHPTLDSEIRFNSTPNNCNTPSRISVLKEISPLKKRKIKSNENSPEEQETKESKVGKKLTKLTTKRVIILVLVLLLVVPLFSSDYYYRLL